MEFFIKIIKKSDILFEKNNNYFYKIHFFSKKQQAPEPKILLNHAFFDILHEKPETMMIDNTVCMSLYGEIVCFFFYFVKISFYIYIYFFLKKKRVLINYKIVLMELN